MKLKLVRKEFTNTSTIGELFIDGIFFCYVLEDTDRLGRGEKKVFGKTAIPKGEYVVEKTFSPRFKKVLPLLANVPGFSGVRIHSGNTDKDTEGCLIVGFTKGKDFVGDSRKAMQRLMEELSKSNQIKIEIT